MAPGACTAAMLVPEEPGRAARVPVRREPSSGPRDAPSCSRTSYVPAGLRRCWRLPRLHPICLLWPRQASANAELARRSTCAGSSADPAVTSHSRPVPVASFQVASLSRRPAPFPTSFSRFCIFDDPLGACKLSFWKPGRRYLISADIFFLRFRPPGAFSAAHRRHRRAAERLSLWSTFCAQRTLQLHSPAPPAPPKLVDNSSSEALLANQRPPLSSAGHPSDSLPALLIPGDVPPPTTSQHAGLTSLNHWGACRSAAVVSRGPRAVYQGMADKMSIDNKPPNPPHRDESEESTGSTPETEQNPSMTAGSGSTIINVSQDGQQPKRKGGRKPVSCPFFPFTSLSCVFS
ncbi:meab [Trichoderma arundinaceum]|uniref:Meab n=1 Tax=Trichoderma arundinaceum TaxID=490622 RepID=A0A395NBZ7_TRIAR|nr:meab [Trichoderma arundinaceum]